MGGNEKKANSWSYVGTKCCWNIVRTATSHLCMPAIVLVSVCHEFWEEGEHLGRK